MENDEVIKIRNRFLRLLKENNLLNAYIRNYNKDCKLPEGERTIDYDVSNVWNLLDIKNHIESLNKYLSEDGEDVFLNYAFLWENTIEGYRCWFNLNSLWKYKLYDCDVDDMLRDDKQYILDG